MVLWFAALAALVVLAGYTLVRVVRSRLRAGREIGAGPDGNDRPQP